MKAALFSRSAAVVGDDRRAKAVSVGQLVDVQPVPLPENLQELVDPQRHRAQVHRLFVRSAQECELQEHLKHAAVEREPALAQPGLRDYRARPVLEKQGVQAVGQVPPVE